MAESFKHNYNPDVLTCLANLSNDEVFTPPVLVNQMLDLLPTELWQNKDAKFLDPVTKSGVFLREIAKRLNAGLAEQIPDQQARLNHIFTQQIYGIAITELTSLLARRSVYCSKAANSPHSICTEFEDAHGNILFERIQHEWVETKCRYCSAPRATFDREEGRETHAYPFIHSNNIKTRIVELFGGNMQFDVIVGNPPYQMTGAAGGGVDSSIYHLFIDQAKRLAPRYVSMIIPSRWMAGGRGVGDFDGFRQRMLGDRGIRELVDFPVASEVFPGVEVKGGVCYFLWDRGYNGLAKVTAIRGKEQITAIRALDEFDVFIRNPIAVEILHKVLEQREKSITEILTNKEPFKFETNFAGYHPVANFGDLPIYFISSGKRSIAYIEPSKVEKNKHLVSTWKVLVPQAYGAGETVPHQIVGKPIIAPSPSVCTGSFMFFWVDSQAEAAGVQSYYSTKFFRFLVSLRKITQLAQRSVYTFVPIQDFSQPWTDEKLYKKYSLTPEEIAFVESMIRPMDLGM